MAAQVDAGTPVDDSLWVPLAAQQVLLSLVLVLLLEMSGRGRTGLDRACTLASAKLQEEL